MSGNMTLSVWSCALRMFKYEQLASCVFKKKNDHNACACLFVVSFLMLSLLSVDAADQPKKEIRIGLFPNITHAQALLAKSSGAYEKAMGVPIHWVIFNAGPSAIEAILADALDAAYIGPNPAINGFIKSGGKSFQVVAGSASGGAALVVRAGSGINGEKDFSGKIVATPQLGNTQDVAARAWFKAKGCQLKEKGGALTILPLANPDQLLMFKRKEIDAAWTIEPWVSRLEQECGGKIMVDEKDLWPKGQYVTTVLLVSQKFMRANPDVVDKLVQAHVEMTARLNSDKCAAIPVINAEIKKITGSALSQSVMESAMKRVDFVSDLMQEPLIQSARLAHEAGFLREKPVLDGLCNPRFLESIAEAISVKGQINK